VKDRYQPNLASTIEDPIESCGLKKQPDIEKTVLHFSFEVRRDLIALGVSPLDLRCLECRPSGSRTKMYRPFGQTGGVITFFRQSRPHQKHVERCRKLPHNRRVVSYVRYVFSPFTLSESEIKHQLSNRNPTCQTSDVWRNQTSDGGLVHTHALPREPYAMVTDEIPVEATRVFVGVSELAEDV